MVIDLLCRDSENREHLDHYFQDYILHFGSRLHLDVDFETQKEGLHTLEDVNDGTMTRTNILNRLRCGHQMASAKVYTMRGYALKGEHLLLQRSILQARKPVNKEI